MIKLIFSEKPVDGAINFPENGLKPENQVKWVEENLSEAMTIVTVSTYIYQAVYYYAKQRKIPEAIFKAFNEDKEINDLSEVFEEMARPLDKMVWDEVID